MEATQCIKCGARHWSREPCKKSSPVAEFIDCSVAVIASLPLETAKAVAAEMLGQASPPPAAIETGPSSAKLDKVAKAREWNKANRGAYNERQRVYMRKRRAEAKK